MEELDICWQYRLDHYSKALLKLEKAVALDREKRLSELEKLGIIHTFEFTHELAWKVMQDFLFIKEIQNYVVQEMQHAKLLVWS